MPARLDAFLEAKLHPPAARTKWVQRDRLMQAMERSTTDFPLTLVAAPAGYGKTTAVAQWLDQMSDRSLAWVSLDSADNDPVRMWTHIATALERAKCVFAGGAAGLVAAHSGEITDRVLPEIVNALAEAPVPILLVLDDYHFVRADECHEQMDFLIEHLPPADAILILTRADPALRLGRLRASRRLGEIRADRLSFDRDETNALLGGEDIHLSDVALSELMMRTEGWPAGLYLAAMSLIGRDDPDSFVHEFSGDNRFVGDYLMEEVLSRQPDAVRAFILDVSILQRFSAPLCEYVLQTDGASRILHDLERSNLFLMPLDANRHWFRFHHLFAAVARSEFQSDNPVRVTQLHDRAAEWFAAHGFVDEAVGHAIAAGSVTRASQLVQANWLRYVGAGRAATVDGWLQELPQFEAEPAALVTAAWMAVIRGDEATVNRLLLALAETDDTNPLPDGTRSVESAVALIQGVSGYGGPQQMAAAAQRAAELETDARSPWYGFAHFALGHARYVAGDLEAVMNVLPKAANNDSSLALTKQLALSMMAMAAREQRDTTLSRRYAVESMALVDAANLRAIPQSSMAFTALGEIQAIEGDLASAMATLDEGLILRQRNPGLSPWPTIYHLLAMGRVTAMAGDLSRAERLLDQAAEVMSRFTDGMDAMQARLGAARATLRRLRLDDPGLESLTPREVDVLRLLPSRLSLAEIAGELYLTRNTVKTHVQALYRKLGATSRSEAIHLGRRRSLI